MTLDPISIATAGYVCGGCPDPIAIGTLGYVCAVERAVRGGDPEGAWGDRYAYFRRRQRQLRESERTVSRETPAELVEEIDWLDEVITDLEEQLAAIRLEDTTLLKLDLAALEEAQRERELFEQMRVEEITRDNVVYLAAWRAQRKEDELARLIEIGRQIRRQLQDEVAVATALVAILFK